MDIRNFLHKDFLSLFIGTEDVKIFEEKIFGVIPKVFKATEERRKIFDGLYTLKDFETLLKERENDQALKPLKYDIDYKTAKFVNFQRISPMPESENSKDVLNLFNDGVTLQFLQPQRFNENIRTICSELEARVGCLVGCNAYITRQHSQGLAPHHDDVELFICQTQGKKDWIVYKPYNDFYLPNTASPDFLREELGEPILKVSLNVGDVLYIPKGYVHEAKTLGSESVHLTFSTYQRWSWADLLQTTLSECILSNSSPICCPQSLREELPICFIDLCGTMTGNFESNHKTIKNFCTKIRHFADYIEDYPLIIQKGIDTMARDFLENRLPLQYNCNKNEEFDLNDKIKLSRKGIIRLVPIYDVMNCEDINYFEIISSMSNNHKKHMMNIPSSSEDRDDDNEDEREGKTHNDDDAVIANDIEINNDYDFSSEYIEDIKEHLEKKQKVEMPIGEGLFSEMDNKSALIQIMKSGDDGVMISDLKLKNDYEKLRLVRTLHRESIITKCP